MSSFNQVLHKRDSVLKLMNNVKDQINFLTCDETDDKKVGTYLLTSRFKDLAAGVSNEQKLKYVIDSVPIIFKHILNNTVKQNKYSSRQKLHPFLLSFVDYSGSRTNQHQFSTIPHIHSVIVIHPDVNVRFRELMESEFLLTKGHKDTRRILNMEAREIGPTDDDLNTVLDYSSKSYFLKFIPRVPPETQAEMMLLDGFIRK